MALKRIELTEEQECFLTTVLEQKRDAEIALQEVSSNLRQSTNRLWDSLMELFPNILRENMRELEHKPGKRMALHIREEEE